MSSKLLVALACGILAVASLPAIAAEPVKGPAAVDLPDAGAKINLPAGYIFVGKEDATKFLEEQGSDGEGVVGIIAPATEGDDNFIVVAEFDPCGYVNDEDANKLNADDILKSYKEGTEEQNQARKDHGLGPLYVGGWAEQPRYEKGKHQVIWGLNVKHEDTASAAVTGVNYNTRVLGRRGVLSMNLVTDPDKLAANKPKVAVILDNTSFTKGNAYGDYVAGKDKSAGYGLAGLILGGGAMAAAAKLGLLGGLWKWALGILLVFKKFAIVGIVAIGALFSKIFKRGGKDSGTST